MKNTVQHLNEWYGLISLLKKNNIKSFIEIGTRNGGTFESLSSICEGKKISIDLSSGSFGGIGIDKVEERNKRISAKYEDAIFIEGDSHKIETVEKLNNVLNGDRVDFMFIDGDHTYKGVLSDWMMYRQYVKPGGIIAFHDIIASDFHHANGCFVDLLWASLSDIHIEQWISPDNSDATEDANNFSHDIRWGGIGAVRNEYSRDVELFIPIHDQKGIDYTLSHMKKYIPTFIYNNDNIYFENTAIIKVFDNISFSDKQKIGITSSIQQHKTQMSFDDIVESSKDTEFLNYYSPAWGSYDVWSENRFHTTLHYTAGKELNDAKILPVDIYNSEWELLYCNYFVAKYDIFKKYIDKWLKPAITFLSKTRWVNRNSHDGLLYKGAYYPMAVFLIESLPGLFINNIGISHKKRIK